jgi:hypothetical protein
MSDVQNDTKNLKVVVLDETQYWREDIAKEAGKLFGVYLYDASRGVYACELTPSHELWFLYTTSENPLSDELYEAIVEGDSYTEPVSYMHCWRVKGLKHVAAREADPELSYEENIREAWEYYQGNCPF